MEKAGTGAGTILIVSHTNDMHALDVLRRLEQQGADVVLFDTGRLPRETLLSITHGAAGWGANARFDGRDFDFSSVRSVWWRRPQPFQLDPSVSNEEDRHFVHGETHAAVSALWSLLDAQWVNDPDRDEAASRKGWQLRLAREAGLRIPETLLTNNPDAARAFVAGQGGRPVIYKAFSATESTWRETRVLRPEEAVLLDSVKLAPVIFQEHVPAIYDVRVTVVGDQVFAAAIHSQQTSYVHDFRIDMDNARIEAIEMPAEIVAGLLRLMARLGLVYGAADFRLTPDGEWVFLEVNPAGQWLFVEQATHQPIAAALAAKLMELAALAPA